MIVLRVLWGLFFAFVTIGSLSEQFWIPAILFAICCAMAFPRFWAFVGQYAPSLTRRSKGAIAVGLGFVSLMLLGIASDLTPAVRAERAAREKQEAAQLAVTAKADAEATAISNAKAAKQQAEADRKAELAEVEKQKSGLHCLSGWDGSYAPLVDAVKAAARNPGSFEHIETRIAPVNKKGLNTVMMRYRAQNGFGGMNVEMIGATVDPSDCSIKEIINT